MEHIERRLTAIQAQAYWASCGLVPQDVEEMRRETQYPGESVSWSLEYLKDAPMKDFIFKKVRGAMVPVDFTRRVEIPVIDKSRPWSKEYKGPGMELLQEMLEFCEDLLMWERDPETEVWIYLKATGMCYRIHP